MRWKHSFERIKNFTISIRETNEKSFFLETDSGGSEHSFGIQVAKMAGMPPELIKRSKIILRELRRKQSNRSKNKRYEPFK